MKSCKQYWVLLCLLFLILKDIPLLASVALIRIRRNQVPCVPIGRIINQGDKRLAAKSLVCELEKIEVINGSNVDFLCYSSGEILKLSSGVVSSDKCPRPQAVNPSCNPSNVGVCLRPKGGIGESNEPIIISPYAISTLNSRPEITWTSVKGATSYKVKVSSYKFGWQKIINQTQLDYPVDEKELQPGNVYRIEVFAYKDGNAISNDYTNLIILPISSQQEIALKIESIKNLGLPPDETALDLDAIYASKNLLNESIELLKVQTMTPAGSKNPSLYRTLGDRYLGAWLPNEANREYAKAVELANSTKNSVELKQAQEGLKLVEFYNQLPISRNGAQ